MASPDELDPRLRALLDEERGTPLRGVGDAKARGLARLMATIAASRGDVGDANVSEAPSEKLAGKGDKTGKGDSDTESSGTESHGPSHEPSHGASGSAETSAKPEADAPTSSGVSVPKPDGRSGASELVRPTLATVSTKTLMWVALASGVAGAVVGATTMWAVTKPEASSATLEAVAVEDAVQPMVEEPTVAAPAHEEPALDDGGPAEEAVAVAPETSAMRRVRPEAPTPEAPSTIDEPSSDVPRSALARERALIDQARAALRAGRPHDALVALMGHEREFADGTLAEERERLAIEALVRSDRLPAARRKAAAFATRFPSSAHRARIEALVAE